MSARIALWLWRPGQGYGPHAATPADMRLWLLDQGAEEHQWCEAHNSPAVDDGCQESRYLLQDGGIYCRMVSVLVWRTPDSEQVSPATN